MFFSCVGNSCVCQLCVELMCIFSCVGTSCVCQLCRELMFMLVVWGAVVYVS
jgi:hypothetical protein